MKELKVVEEVPAFFVVMGICIQKTMNTKILYQKNFRHSLLWIGKFFDNQKHNHPKSFAEIEKKTKYWSKNKELV